MRRLSRAALALLVAAASTGCVLSRQITEVASHDSYNSYKVQTATVRFAVLTAWVTWEVWSCHKHGHVFRCTKLDYQTSRSGFRSGAPAPALVPDSAAPVAPAPVAPPPPAPAQPPAAPNPPAPPAAQPPAPSAPPAPAPPPASPAPQGPAGKDLYGPRT